jgi:FAD:protein FMN transferase
MTLRSTYHHQIVKLMGNRFEFTVVANDAPWAQARIEEAIVEVKRIESLLTTFSESSQTNRINAMAGIKPVSIDREVFDLIERSIQISSLTQGAFDITYGSVDKRLWNFDTTMTALPDPELARKMVRLINYRNIILDKQQGTVFLKEKGMRIGFGGIGKGYAADRVKNLLKKAGIKGGVVNASGDLTVWGTQSNGYPWTVGIADPTMKDLPFASVRLADTAIATSGNYQKFAVINGTRYSHTINPKTGMPIRGIKSATIICASAEIADAMATPLMIMGIEAGIGLINQMKDIACIVIDDYDTVYTSKNINLIS